MADRTETILAIYKAQVEEYNKSMLSMIEHTERSEEAISGLEDFIKGLDKNTKTTSESVDTLSKGVKNSSNVFTKWGRILVGARAPVQLFAKATGQSTQELDGLRLITEKILLTIGLQIGATKDATAATKTATAATKIQTRAERVLNIVKNSGVALWVAVASAITIATVAIFKYVTGLQEEAKATRISQALAKEQIKINNLLTKSFNERSKSLSETALAEGIRTGLITERQAEEIRLTDAHLGRLIDIERKHDDELNKLGERALQNRGTVFLAEENRFLTIGEQIEQNRRDQIEASQADLDAALLKLREKFIKEDEEKRDAARKKQEEEDEASLQRQFNAFIAHFDKLDREERERQKANLKELKKFEVAKQKLRDDAFEEQQNANLKNQTAAQAEVIRLALEGQEAQIDLLRELKEAGLATTEQLNALAMIEKTLNQQRIEDAQRTANIIFQAAQEAFDKRQSLLNEEIDRQESAIERQADLAARGLANTLAFEEKRAADLRRQQQKEVEQAKKVKLLETFLNSLAEFSKTDPKNALNQALLQVALATAATAVFAEEGGIIGEIGERSSFSRTHKGGGDVLLHAQTGEGILSRKEMDNLGHRNFHLLKDVARFPVKENIFSMPEVAIAGGMSVSNEELIKEVKGLRKDIKNQPHTDWSVDKFGNYIKSTMENGVKTILKGKLKRPRFRQ